MDQPANTFTSYIFDGHGHFVGASPPDPVYTSGYDNGAGGTNVVTPASSDPFFEVFFDLDAGATWGGGWQFVVDGSQYTRGSSTPPGEWVENFFGGYPDYGGLPNNTGNGYIVTPEPSSILLLLTAAAGAMLASRRKRA